MADLFKLLCHVATRALGRAVVAAQLRVLRFQPLQLLEQHVELLV